jgi:FkbM family methyltransferase
MIRKQLQNGLSGFRLCPSTFPFLSGFVVAVVLTLVVLTPGKNVKLATSHYSRNRDNGSTEYSTGGDPRGGLRGGLLKYQLSQQPLVAQLPGWWGKFDCGPKFDSKLKYTSKSWWSGTNSFSQHGQEEWLHKNAFGNGHGGFFLELGGLDGLRYSNTALLEKKAGWRGILIEPNPTEFHKMVQNRPNSININAAICSTQGTVHYISSKSGAGGAVGGIWEFMAPTFRSQWYPGMTQESMYKEAMEISCAPLNTLLTRFGLRHIDFWSLDVEGGELEVLETMDFSQVSVGVIVVEQDGHNPGKDRKITDLLLKNGFLIKDTVDTNTYFVHNTYKGRLNSIANQ